MAGLPAAMMLAGAASHALRGVRLAALIGGAIGTVIAAVPLLGLQPIASIVDQGPLWPEAEDGGRIYSPAPSEDTMRWFASGMEPRRLWPVGYLNLVDNLVVVRTDSPVANERLIQHLEMADRGPESRWWLDMLGAQWVILLESSGVPENMESVRVRSGMRLLRNRQAAAVVNVTHEVPRTDITLEPNGRADEVVLEGNGCRAVLDAARDGFVWVALPPVRGWRWMVDGARVNLEQGPGIIQYVPMRRADTCLSAAYRPPGIAAAAATSVAAMIVVVFRREVLVVGRRRWKVDDGIAGEVRPSRHPKDDVSNGGVTSLPNRQKQHRIWLPAALLPVGGALFLVAMGPLLPRAPISTCISSGAGSDAVSASGQLPCGFPISTRGFGSPGIRLYSPLGSGPQRRLSVSCSGKPAADCGPRHSWQRRQSCSCPVLVMGRLQARHTRGPV